MSESYPYEDNIRTPDEINMGSRGTIPQLGRNVRGFTAYKDLLITGSGLASSTGKPLGNKYFLKTSAKCQAKDTCDSTGNGCLETDRYIYINNIPSGTLAGLVPGAVGQLGVLNPFAIFRAFRDGATPPCELITMEVVDNKNNRTEQTHYVTLADIRAMNPCWFNTATHNLTNPVTNRKCREVFQNRVDENAEVVMSDDPVDKVYFAGLSLICIYILYRFMYRGK
jgi:hypothetical protein